MSKENILAIVGDNEFELVNAQIVDDKIVQNGAPAELGKRFTCGAELSRQIIKDGKDTTETVYKSGMVKLKSGIEVNAGCGTEFLVTKASSSHIECCGKPAVLQKPKALPSSD